MPTQTLDATRLKAVRKARKIGRPKLARLTGLTERQISKLEAAGPAGGSVTDDALDRISQILQVPVPALTGDLPLMEEDLQPSAPSTCTNGCCG